MEDIRKTFYEKKAEIESMLETVELSEAERKRIGIAMEFGHATAFCERTLDMAGACRVAQEYRNTYERIRKRLE